MCCQVAAEICCTDKGSAQFFNKFPVSKWWLQWKSQTLNLVNVDPKSLHSYVSPFCDVKSQFLIRDNFDKYGFMNKCHGSSFINVRENYDYPVALAIPRLWLRVPCGFWVHMEYCNTRLSDLGVFTNYIKVTGSLSLSVSSMNRIMTWGN